MKLYVVEGLDGSGKDFLINNMLKYDEKLIQISDGCSKIQNLNDLIYEGTTNKYKSLYSLIEHELMRRIEEAYRSGADRAVVSRFIASTYAYQVYTANLYPNEFFDMYKRIKEYADFFGVRIKYIFRDIGAEIAKQRLSVYDDMDEYFIQNAQKINDGYKEFFEKISDEFVYRMDQQDLTESDIKELVHKIQQSPVEV